MTSLVKSEESLSTLPSTLLASTFSYVRRNDIYATALTCQVLVRRILSERNDADTNELWRSICKLRFSMTDERFLEWRTSSWKILHKILETYIPKEGFYRLEQASPWGILFLFHFYKGRFVGEVMTPVAALVSGVRSNDDACYARETVFVGDFNEDGQLSRGTLFEDHCLFGDKAQEDITVEVFSTFGSPPGEPKLVHVKESDRDIVCHRPRSNGTETSWKLLLLDSLRSNMISPRSSESFKSQVKAIWDSMASTNDHPSQKSQHLYFSYVDGPVQNPGAFEYHEGMPIIRPGLYCGNYELMYGRFQCECLLVEYRRFGLVEKTGSIWNEIGEVVFNYSRQEDPNGIFARVKAGLLESKAQEAIFVIGRKVTGDIHVSAGETTFAALVHPLLEFQENPAVGKTGDIVASRDSEDKVPYHIIRRYGGWGTLAFPGFKNPKWSSGCLMEIRKEGSREAEKYSQIGFLFSDREELTVLQYLPIQHRYPWF